MRPHDLPPDFGDPEIMNLRVPPHSIEAESSVLGGLLLDNRMWALCADVLDYLRQRIATQTATRMRTPTKDVPRARNRVGSHSA